MKKILLLASALTFIAAGCNKKPVTSSNNSVPSQIQSSTPGWKTYHSDLYGFSFEYPETFTIEDSTNDPSVAPDLIRILDPNNKLGSYQGEINTFSSDFGQPNTTDVKTWVISHGYPYQVFKDGQFSNKIGSDYTVASLPTLHLLDHTMSGGTDDVFYFINNHTLYRILITPGAQPTDTSFKDINNLDLTDKNKWYNTFLKSFNFDQSKTSSSTTPISYDQKMSACQAIPNGSTQNITDTTRLFINLPKDVYPDKDHNLQFRRISGNVTSGSIAGFGGEAYQATPDCWSYYNEFDGQGEIDLTVKSAISGMPDYKVKFIVK